MREVVLQRVCSDGKLLKAVFYPDHGMNLASLQKGDLEIIDPSTRPLFEERLSGLGPLIGPHFYHRKEEDIPFIPDETSFPHIAKLKEKKEPFSHGIGRYVPWNFEASDLTISAHISGIDTVNGVTLAALEGFDFRMDFKVHLTDQGLDINLFTESEEKPSVCGLHYYYHLNNKKGQVVMYSEDSYGDMGVLKPIPDAWKTSEKDKIVLNMQDNEYDYTFFPKMLNHTGEAILETQSYQLKVHYQADNEENSFQVYHPQNASFICVEPISAKNPRGAQQMKNHLRVHIEIL